MHTRHRIGKFVCLVAFVAAPVIAAACTSTPNRVYDPYYNDGHPWTRDEDRFYRNWEEETHRQHVDFDHRIASEQHAYFDWRHNRTDAAR